MISFTVKPFEELSNVELYQLLKLRAEVFVVEQNCVYLDMDEKDYKCLHVLGFEKEVLVAYSRLVPPGISYKEASIGRVVTHPIVRKLGYGKELMQFSIAQTKEHFNVGEIVISAQLYLERFYQSRLGVIGFVAEGEPYLEDDIPHIKMRLK